MKPKYRWKTTENHVGSTGKRWKLSPEACKAKSERMKGHEVSEETRQKLSIAHKGKKNPKSEQARRNQSIALKRFFANGGVIPSGNLGKKASPETIKKLRESHVGQNTGESHWNWQGGKTALTQKIRNSFEYKEWRRTVFERDNYTCIWCGDNRGGNLNADHIKRFALYPELRLDPDNGRTLCVDCHKTTDTYGRLKCQGGQT